VKLQVTLRCPLSRRQKELYAALRKNLTLQDLVAMNSKMAAAAAAAAAGAAGAGSSGPAAGSSAPVTAASSSAASARLMGLIMQMRKVGVEVFIECVGCWPARVNVYQRAAG
jgi:hypothetical protein